VATAQSQIAHALLIQFEFIHHKPLMMHEFRDYLIWDSRSRAGVAVLELGSVPLPVVTARIDRFIAEGGKGPYPDME
jgi:hypothetical protein